MSFLAERGPLRQSEPNACVRQQARQPRRKGREESRGRREAAASESGTPIGELDESDIIACADDEFLCSEALALWALIRKARALAG